MVSVTRSEIGNLKSEIPTVVIQPTRGWISLRSLQLRAVWQYRELLYFLVWRDVKVRYKQTALGVLWVVLQPIISMVVFSLLFGGLLKVPSAKGVFPPPHHSAQRSAGAGRASLADIGLDFCAVVGDRGSGAG